MSNAASVCIAQIAIGAEGLASGRARWPAPHRQSGSCSAKLRHSGAGSHHARIGSGNGPHGREADLFDR
jgi:hypothetical protein